MGGFGSGMWMRANTKPVVEESIVLDTKTFTKRRWYSSLCSEATHTPVVCCPKRRRRGQLNVDSVEQLSQ